MRGIERRASDEFLPNRRNYSLFNDEIAFFEGIREHASGW